MNPDPSSSWREFLSLVPDFHCSDEMLTRYYWYRWYGLRLNALSAGGSYPSPAITEGLAYFRGVITYSLMCHLYEAKWLADPGLAQGCLRAHLAHQTKAGHFPAHIYVNHVNAQGFYHTDVGRSAGELLAHHPDGSFAREIYPGLRRLFEFYRRERDHEGLALYDLCDQYETGQEFSSRYFHADKNADLYGWEEKLRLKGVEVTQYVYELAKLLERLAGGLGRMKESRDFALAALSIEEAARKHLWDPRRSFFFDYNAQSSRRSPVWPAIGLYPIMSELSTPAQALACAAHLDDPAKFAAPWPTPSLAMDDPHFSAEPRWRKERANCPWNGRVWPMVNSHVMECYGRLAELEPGKYRQRAAAFLRRFIEMMHFEKEGPLAGGGLVPSRAAERRAPSKSEGTRPSPAKDFSRPNCFEHYHPFDGTACEYRRIDDYMHSWVADLILKYVCGLRLRDGLLRVDPLPFGLTHFALRGAFIRGHRVDVYWNRTPKGSHGEGYRIDIDGSVAHRSPAIEAAEFEL